MTSRKLGKFEFFRHKFRILRVKMNLKLCLMLKLICFGLVSAAFAGPKVDIDQIGKAVGGWKDKGGRAAKFEVSGSTYRNWKPEVSPTLTGGLFVSVRIDHLRGAFATDDHASLEVTFDDKGNVVQARSSLAFQGKRITSDVVDNVGRAGANLVGMERAAKVGTDMVTSLSAKILRENIQEPGRVSFPAVLQHQYNLLCMAVRVAEAEEGEEVEPGEGKKNERKEAPLVIEPTRR